MSNFSFSYSVFKRLVSQGRQKVTLCGNGLNRGVTIHWTIDASRWRAQGSTLIFLAARQSGLLLPDAAGLTKCSLVLTNCLFQTLGNALLRGFL